MKTYLAFAALFALAILSSGCSHVKMGLFMFNSNPALDDSASVVRGKAAFLTNCARCHGENADGVGSEMARLSRPPTNFRSPDFNKSAVLIAAHTSYGKGSDMPAFEGQIPYATIWDIANYLHSLQ